MQNYQPTSGIESVVPDHRAPKVKSGQRGKGFIIAPLVLGWVALLYATNLPLLEAIQVAAVGLGGLVTAVVAALWNRA